MRPRRIALGVGLVAAAFAVHAVPAGIPAVRDASVALAPGHRVAFALPAAFAPVPGRDDAWQVAEGDGLRSCRTVIAVGAEASDRGIRYDAEARRLAYRFAGRRRELAVAQARERGDRRAFRGDVRRSRVGAQPVEAVVRFPPPPTAGLPPAVLVRATVETFADTSSVVQRTPSYLAGCARRTREAAPGALDAIAATAEVVRAPPAGP